MASPRRHCSAAAVLAGVAALAVTAGAAVTSAVDPPLDLILYGATGCVGHLAALHLVKIPGLRWGIADINLPKLEALAAELNTTGRKANPPEVMLQLLSQGNLSDFVRKAKVVITAAGPYSIHDGEALVAACAKNGVHYADVSDEFFWQREMEDRYSRLASTTGAKIVLSAGFCAMAGDLGSQTALNRLNSTLNVVNVDAWLEEYNGGISAGVIAGQTADKNATFPKEWTTDPYVLAPNASASLKLDTLVDGMTYPTHVEGEGEVVSNIFGPYDARLLRRTFTERGQRVRLRVGALPSLYTKWSAFIALHPGSWSTLTKCPTQDIITGGKWSYRFRATAANKSKGLVDTSELVLSGAGDPGYNFTSATLAETGLCLAGLIPGCLRSEVGGGIAPPMVTLSSEVMLNRLITIGLVKVSNSDQISTSSTDHAAYLRALAAVRRIGLGM